MGLDIFYDLHAPDGWDSNRVRKTLTKAREFALGLGFAEVGPVEPNDPEHPVSICLKRHSKKYAFLSVEAKRGWRFRTWPGEGCETAFFGLCRFPSHLEKDGRSFATGYGKGWHYHTWCKTQYADVISREHFLKCHLGVIRILDFLKEAGLKVGARDGGDYWKTRDLKRLAAKLDEMHCLVAAVTGAFKDASEKMTGQVISPITGKKNFEHLEARGREMMARTRVSKRRARGEQS